MAAPVGRIPGDCGAALHALVEGRLTEWRGLPATCRLSRLASAFGGATMLDTSVRLGQDDVRCARSSLETAAVTVWHKGDAVLLVEIDMLSQPCDLPEFARAPADRLDLQPTHAAISELVFGERGLSLLVTAGRRVVGCRGFPPMSVRDYVRLGRPQDREPRPQIRPARFAPSLDRQRATP